MTYQTYIKFCFKELNKNKSKIMKVFFTIFISLLIFSSVTSLKNSIQSEIKNNSKILLGGDLELATKNKPLKLDFLEKLKENYLITEIVEFTTILRANNKDSKAIRIKAIDNFYPLVGEVKVNPPEALVTLKKKTNTILIEKSTKNNLNLSLGEIVKIQNTSFEVVGFIDSLPDIGGFFLFGDQAIINKSSLSNLKINNLGTFMSFKYKLIAKNNNQEIRNKIKEKENFVIKYPEDISENLSKSIENFIYFLSIISASAILISGIGLKNSLFSFLSNNQFEIAIYKSLGLSSKNIKTLYYFQTIIVLIFCSFLAYLSGLLIVSFFNNSLLNFLNIESKIIFRVKEYFIIQFFSIIIFFIFAKPVLNCIDQIKVADLFRNSNSNLDFYYTKKSGFETGIFLSIFILLFCFFNVKPIQTAVFFVFFLITSFFFYILSKFFILILNKIRNIKNLTIRMGIKNLNTYQALNSVIVMTMGLGVTTLFFLGILSSNISKELSSSIPKNAPDYFFLGIQNNELDLFSEQVNRIDPKSKQKIVPMISARIDLINNKKPKEFIDKKNKSFWFINGERRISWSENPPSNNPVVEGKWWNLDDTNNLKISLDQKVANNLNLKIGDSITFNIYGNSVSGIITNFRKVDYQDLNINFAILLNPKFASKIPHEFMSTVKFKNEKSVNLSSLLKNLPNITYIKLSEYISKTKSFLNKLFFVSMLVSSIVIVIGLFVISNAISVVGNLKIYQNLVFTILGFEKSSTIKLIIFESLIMFFPIILTSLMFAIIFSYIFITQIFNIDFSFSFFVPFIISILFLLVLVSTLLFSNRRFINLNAYALLRHG